MITLIDYDVGNLGSLSNTFMKLGYKTQISRDAQIIKKAEILVLPGVGNAVGGMVNLKKYKLDKLIIEQIKKGKPFLGICLGMQLLFEKSEEGNTACLGILKGRVKKFRQERKVPQIGWNNLKFSIFNDQFSIKLFIKVKNNSYFYFVNSYYCEPEDKSIVVAETEYGEKFASVIVKDNIVATQFHPEKSGAAGMQLLKNIINYLKGKYVD